MDPSLEENFLRLAAENPGITCAEAPAEILEASAADAEPTKFLEEYFAKGYSGWLSLKFGRQIHPPQDRIDRAIIVLWLRACLLNTDRILNRNYEDPDQPFFSDDGLY
ncbi:MAG: hypothetical protein BZY88_01325 [SAR202 cluster bacterium Io17-Chloro-G9]|nr:MAG: hypothetical protein BZY88_01325 [SAR202 cluster bacterium Io17-Chloro-G9]